MKKRLLIPLLILAVFATSALAGYDNITYGCTLTQGYWKTHSALGPAAHPDDAWQDIRPDAENSSFFLSGQSWYQVFWSQGSPYYQLAHQYMAAYLNIRNGASVTPAVFSAYSNAKVFFQAYAPWEVEGLTGRSVLRQQMLRYAELLKNYNEGIVGPGSCEEDT